MQDISYAYQELFAAVMIASIVFMIVILIGIYVLTAVFYMKLFAKANARTWKAWVPFINTWKFLELGGYPGALSLLSPLGSIVGLFFFVPYYYNILTFNYATMSDYSLLLSIFSPLATVSYFVNMICSSVVSVLMCMAAYQIGKKLGKDGSWVVLYIFLTIIWLGIVAFNKAVWNDSLGKPARGPERPPSWPLSGMQGYPPQQGYTPPPQGFVLPPQPGYAPLPQGFAPPTQPGYAPLPQGFAPSPQPGYAPPPDFTQPPQGFVPPQQGFVPPPQS